MRRSWVWVGAAAVIITLAAGGAYLARGRSAAQEPQRARDPGLAVVLAIRVLERTPDTRLTKEQIAKILPFVKALKDIPVTDVEVTRAIARTVRDTLTPGQRAALEDAARRTRERLQDAPTRGVGSVPSSGGFGGGATGGAGAPGAGGIRRPGGPRAGPAAISDDQRAQFRLRIFDGMIRALEVRMRS